MNTLLRSRSSTSSWRVSWRVLRRLNSAHFVGGVMIDVHRWIFLPARVNPVDESLKRDLFFNPIVSPPITEFQLPDRFVYGPRCQTSIPIHRGLADILPCRRTHRLNRPVEASQAHRLTIGPFVRQNLVARLCIRIRFPIIARLALKSRL